LTPLGFSGVGGGSQEVVAEARRHPLFELVPREPETSTGFAEAKIWHLLGSAALQRLLAIASLHSISSERQLRNGRPALLGEEKVPGSNPGVGSQFSETVSLHLQGGWTP